MALQRYFLELMYKGTEYSGFQVQKNVPTTVQEAVEKAFVVLQKQTVVLTGSSRTDAGVHARQNFFHFDFDGLLNEHFRYKINAILPKDIVIKNVYAVPADAHCRFDAIARSYKYYIYRSKNPFLADRAYFFPYVLDLEKMQQAAEVIKGYSDFTSFSKRNTQVKTFLCSIAESEWKQEDDMLVYCVKANRFLRGMVRGLTGTMLQVGRNKISIEQFKQAVEAKDCSKADFAVPGHGLFLEEVIYPESYLPAPLALR
ncbi:MAG: tRNA pseudouridine(38-40) synthase TruA [Chitinophagaceae bacterium]